MIYYHLIFLKGDSEMNGILLFDLDGTLLRSDKTISERTLAAIEKSRRDGFVIGVSTSRSKSNSRKFIGSLSPEIIISSGGAMVTLNGMDIVTEEFDGEETARIIAAARRICGDLNITADTADENAEYFRNFTPPADELEKSWGTSIFTDFNGFDKPAMKLCFEIADDEKARLLGEELSWCDFLHFTDGDWYKVTKAGVTKENAINRLCTYLGITPEVMTAFGDDLADIGMLGMCGTGVAMGNALPEVKAAADIIIGTNDEDGIAVYLEEYLRKRA